MAKTPNGPPNLADRLTNSGLWSCTPAWTLKVGTCSIITWICRANVVTCWCWWRKHFKQTQRLRLFLRAQRPEALYRLLHSLIHVFTLPCVVYAIADCI